MINSALMMIHCIRIVDQSHLYVYGDHVCYSDWQIGIIVILLPCLIMFPICFEMAIRLLKDKLISPWQFVCATICPYYAVIIYTWKRKYQRKTNVVSKLLSPDEELFRKTILEGEELLFKEVGNLSIGWTVVQFYRTFALSSFNIFITNQLYKQLAYGVVIIFFLRHDCRRNPYKNEYLNSLQSLTSACLMIVLLCNVIPGMSYVVSLENVPSISEIVKVLGVVELLMYAVVPLSLPVWRATTYIKNKVSKEGNEEKPAGD